MVPARAFLPLFGVWQAATANHVFLHQQLLAQVAGPVRFDADDGDWQITPDVQKVDPVQSVRHYSKSDPLNGRAIGDAIEFLKSSHHQVCMTVDNASLGGLANTMGLVNTAMDLAFLHQVSWIMPSITPPAHSINDTFADMFGKAEPCEERILPYWKAHCPSEQVSLEERHGHAIPENERVHYGRHSDWPCVATESVVDGPRMGRTRACGCDVLVVQGRSQWHFDYSRTGPVLSKMFWEHEAAHKSLDPTSISVFPLATVMHIRLGDVEGRTTGTARGKFVDGQKMAAVVTAFAAASKINPSCLQVTVVTDGERGDAHVRAVEAAWSDMGVHSIDVSDMNDPVDVAFNHMTHASILIGGPSGFPRFAAVLSQAKVKVFLNQEDNSHPVWYLPGATELEAGSGVAEMQQRIQKNRALMDLVSSCEEWLRG